MNVKVFVQTDHRPKKATKSIMPTKILELLHTDLAGSMKIPLLSVSKYFMPLMDDSSGLSLVRFLKKKDKAAGALKKRITEIENRANSTVKRVRSNNGTEFISQHLSDWFKSQGISPESSAIYSPGSNEKAERLVRALSDMARCNLKTASNIPGYEKLWEEAIDLSNLTRNCLFTTSGNQKDKTAYEVVMRKKPNLKVLRIFRSQVFIHNPKAKCDWKFGPRATTGVMVGYEDGYGYRIYNPQSERILVSQDDKFIENISKHFRKEKEIDLPQTVTFDNLDSDEKSDNETNSTKIDHGQELADDGTDDENSTDIEDLTYYQNIRRSSGLTRVPERYFDLIAIQALYGDCSGEIPLSYDDAINCKESEKWTIAIEQEPNAIKERHTWVVVKLPVGARTMGSKWVFDKKKDKNGNNSRFKARIVAQGFSQQKGIDYDEVCSPVAKYLTP